MKNNLEYIDSLTQGILSDFKLQPKTSWSVFNNKLNVSQTKKKKEQSGFKKITKILVPVFIISIISLFIFNTAKPESKKIIALKYIGRKALVHTKRRFFQCLC